MATGEYRMTETPKPTGLALLRTPFPPHLISKLPKPTKAQTDAVRADFKKGIRCEQCGAWHHPDVVHLDYVGHAALTDRLLDCDPEWNWTPYALDQRGLPAFDQEGGMWINLTVCNVTRPGYGHADGKTGGNAIKEAIGDAMRNAAMRFGAALDLWHKGDLHADDDDGNAAAASPERQSAPKDVPTPSEDTLTQMIGLCNALGGNAAQTIIEHYKVSALGELTAKQAVAAIKRLNEKLAERAAQEAALRPEGFGAIDTSKVAF